MTDVLELKLDALSSRMDTRFSHADMERTGLVSWMERVSTAVDRLVALSSATLVLQQRVATVEADIADMALDVDGLDTRVNEIEINRKADGIVTKGIWAAVAATGGALAVFLFDKLIGK